MAQLIEVTGKDFCGYESFTLPLLKQGLIWVGGENRDSDAATSNGSGKTSLYKSLPWCLYGESIDGETGDKVIRRGTKCAQVKTKLADDDGKIWVVVRERRKGSPLLALIQPDGKPFKGSKEDVQNKVIDMVGLDFKAFKNTVMYGQNDTARFARPTTKDGERKDTLHRAMRTDVLKSCHEWALERARELKADVNLAEAEIARIDARAGEHDTARAQLDFDRFEEDRAEAIEASTEEARRLRGQAAAAAAEKTAAAPGVSTEALKARIAKLEAQQHKSEESVGKADKALEALEKLREKRAALRDKHNETETQLQTLDAQLHALKGSKCPTCTTPLAAGTTAAKHKHELADQHTALTAAISALEKQWEKADAEVRAKQGEYDGHSESARQQPHILREIGKAQQEIAAAEREREAAKARAEAAAERSQHYVEQAKHHLARAKEWHARENPHAAQLAAAKVKLRELKDARKAHEAKRDAKAMDLAHMEFWSRGFGNQGLPSYVLDSVMPYITERANHYLETLADGDIKLLFSTQRELKSAKGEMRDEISITWEIEGLDDSYPPSGGQLKKMEIATDLALMDLVASREGGSMDLLMMDEVLDGLDPEGRQRVLHLLHELRAKRGSIFVISHDAEVAEIFEKSIIVVKDGGLSSLERH